MNYLLILVLALALAGCSIFSADHQYTAQVNQAKQAPGNGQAGFGFQMGMARPAAEQHKQALLDSRATFLVLPSKERIELQQLQLGYLHDSLVEVQVVLQLDAEAERQEVEQQLDRQYGGESFAHQAAGVPARSWFQGPVEIELLPGGPGALRLHYSNLKRQAAYQAEEYTRARAQGDATSL